MKFKEIIKDTQVLRGPWNSLIAIKYTAVSLTVWMKFHQKTSVEKKMAEYTQYMLKISIYNNRSQKPEKSY